MAKSHLDNFTSHSDFNEIYYFSCLPIEMQTNALEEYFNNLKIGKIFAHNGESSKLLINKFAKIKNHQSILIMCEREGFWCERESYMPWVIVEVYFECGKFIHSKLASYFEKYDASRTFQAKKQFE